MSTEDPIQTPYKIIEMLGAGGYGQVFLAQSTLDETKIVAMKQLRPGSGIERSKQFEDEAAILEYLSAWAHKNVIQLFEIQKFGMQMYICMEFAAGGVLLDKCDGRMSTEVAHFYFSQLIDGLEFIHGLGIAHRDIKPENLLLTSDNVLKLSDFGAAGFFRQEGQEYLLHKSVGTNEYKAPELVEGLPYKGNAVDIWAAGITLVAMLTGHLPWKKACNSNETYSRWVNELSINEMPWELMDPHAVALLMNILTPDPNQRATIDEIRISSWYTRVLRGY